MSQFSLKSCSILIGLLISFLGFMAITDSNVVMAQGITVAVSRQGTTYEARLVALNVDCDGYKLDNCDAFDTIQSALNWVAALVVPLTVILMIIGGIQYSAAQNNPEALKSAKATIFKAVIGLLCFIFMWAFLKWLIPGGLG